MVEAVHHHRPTLKQQNKPFKSKHASKSSLRNLAKGRILRQSPKASPTSNTAAQSRLNRRNYAKQTQLKKRQAIVSATRIFNGVDGAPRIVAVIPLSDDVDAETAVHDILGSLDIAADASPESGLGKYKVDRFKTSLQFINLPYRDFFAALDACKVADYVVFLLSSSKEVEDWGDTLLRTLQAQGLPEVITVVSSISHMDSKSRTEIMKSLLSFIQYFVPSQKRIFDLHTPSDRLNALRALSESRPADVKWREGRTYIAGEEVRWDNGTLSVTGIVRGIPLSANRLIHIPNYGDYQISKIMSAPAAYSKSGHGNNIDPEPVIIAEPDPSDADSLVSSNDPDDMANEQTWPTAEEMQGAVEEEDRTKLPDAKAGTTPRRVRRIPKGMSEYQAAWILDDDEDQEDDEGLAGEDENEIRDEEMQDGEEAEEMVDLPEAEAEKDMDLDSRRSVAFEDLDMEDEAEQLEKWRKRKREEEDDLAFPDEIDTPQDITARTRFQRYRGMRSFRTSPWDPYENLPRDYARIFQFEDFKRTERSVRRRADSEPNTVEPGARVTIFLRDVPEEVAHKDSRYPFIIFSLLQHERKKTVLNFTLQRNTEYDGSVRSKDSLILCVGPRRLRVNPIFSQHTRGGGRGVNNVHKFERYLRHGTTTVATVYGPVIYGKQPCILLRETSDLQAPHLVAMGSFLNPDPTRIVAKRIILTGHPFKIHKRTATVRYMFFNTDDILYFKPIQLHTKHGRSGHIKESLGTHGYFKAHFDGPINQMDTVCMTLYKRVYPKWSEFWNQSPSKPEASYAMEE